MVTNPDITASSDDSDSEGSVESIQSKTTWKDQLLQFSNFASLLCVLDCTILPIVTIVFPLMGILVSASQLEWLHQAGHAVALGFVLPVGGMATVTNYLYNHRTKWIAAIGCLGLLLVGSANAGCSLVPHGVGGTVGHFVHEMLHTLHHGIQHRVANLAGCALLLLSNYLSRKKAAEKATCSGGAGCNHSHH
jgi:putative flippase GtrA